MASEKSNWSIETKKLAHDLHADLSINNKTWHQLKNNPNRRAAELLSGAMVQLINGGDLSDIEDMMEQGLRWLRREIRDPGCPHH